MNTSAAMAISSPKSDQPSAPQLRVIASAGFFHCEHGVSEHHHCAQCEAKSRELPSFWDA